MHVRKCKEDKSLREVRQLYVLNNGPYILSIFFRNDVGEVVFQGVLVGRHVRDSFGDVEC